MSNSVTKPFNLTVISTNLAASAAPAYLSTSLYAIGDVVSATSTEDNLAHEYESIRQGRTGTNWSSGTTYSKEQRISKTSTDGFIHEYESVIDANTGNDPVTSGSNYWKDLGPISNYYLTDETWWIDLGPSNRDALLDSRTSTVSEGGTSNTTSGSGEIVITVATGKIFDTIACLNVTDCTNISVEATRSGVTLFSYSSSLGEDVTSWFDYFFSPVDLLDTKAIWRPEVFYSDVQVTFTFSGSTPKVGLIMLGRARELGETEYGATIGIEDYSTKETDQWGRTYLLKREYADTANIKMIIPTGQVDAVKHILADVRATPALYDMNNGDSEFQSLIVFGKYDDFSIDIAYHSVSYCTLSLTGLI